MSGRLQEISTAKDPPASTFPGGSPLDFFWVSEESIKDQQLVSKQLKRKSTSYDGFQMPSRKQLITEEKMAACMQRLSLKQLDLGASMSQSIKDRSDDSDFEDGDDNEDFDSDQQERFPVIEFAPGIKESFKKMSCSIQDSILEKLVQKPCMALIPYVPPADVALRLILQKDTDEKTETKGETTERSSGNDIIMADESFTVEWDSDCDDNFLLD